MTVSVEEAIPLGLFSHLENAFSPVPSIAWPDVAFTPPAVTVPPADPAYWLRATLLKGDTTSVGINYASSDLHVGVFQIDVFHQENSGEIRPRQIASQIAAVFRKGTKISVEDSPARIEIIQPPSVLNLRRDAPWVLIPVRIRWMCTDRNSA